MSQRNPFKWRHFEAEIILLCVRWYLRYALSYRDLEEMMLERGLSVDHTTLYRWVQHYAAITPRVAEIITRLRAYLRLTEEDRLLLKLYYQDGIKIKVIVKLLNLQGDPYKRIKKIIAQIQKACQKAGLLLGEA